ncbi:MAG TPA: DUF1801 domain-containing protein [Acidimicrobiia bacterium]|nr:DUF1801 domain-containing protein [Acidimicrobiia bacterium]
MRSDADTVAGYLDSLPDDRREAIATVRRTILDNLPAGYEEAMNWGMIAYQVPLETYPETYNGRPLMYAALASQKNHMAVYLTGVYSDETVLQAFVDDYETTGAKLDMGKSCVRFRRLDDLPLDVVGRTIAAVGVDDFIAMMERVKRR